MKNIRRSQASRLRLIIEIIRSGSATRRLPSASDIATALEVSWRTIIRDIEWLRDDEGAPIEYDASRKGYFLKDQRWTFKPVTLTQKEVYAFALASRMLSSFKGTPLEDELQSLFKKIDYSIKGTATLAAATIFDQVSFVADDYVPLNKDRWLAMATHIRRREAIGVSYRTFKGEIKSYNLSPVQLVSYHGNWYALAFRHDKQETATFALSRILSMRKLKTKSQAPVNCDVATLVNNAFGITQGEKDLDVHLRVSKNIATYIAERIWHPKQRIIPQKGGGLDIYFTTRNWKELVRWILSWQPDITVLAPAELRNRVEEKMREGIRQQRTG